MVVTAYMSKWLTYYLAYSNCLKADALILLGCQDTMINLVAKEPRNYLTVKNKKIEGN
jgi:alpha-D-ribose 1-methylphosphonate 5-triphosphate synthase subunit PhnL